MTLEAECLLLSVTPYSAVTNMYISSNFIFPIHVELSFSAQTAQRRLVKPAEPGLLQLGEPNVFELGLTRHIKLVHRCVIPGRNAGCEILSA